ncbi:MAG: hypothetical protein ACR2IF_06300 [Terriglobales bacterium]
MSSLPNQNSVERPGVPFPPGLELPPLTPVWSNRKLLVIAVCAALMVFFVSAALDWAVIHERESRNVAIDISDALGGIVAGALVYRILQYERDRRRLLRERLQVIADMNHHVRNALQVISLSAFSFADQQQIAAVQESVKRIQWALREILPKV